MDANALSSSASDTSSNSIRFAHLAISYKLTGEVFDHYLLDGYAFRYCPCDSICNLKTSLEIWHHIPTQVRTAAFEFVRKHLGDGLWFLHAASSYGNDATRKLPSVFKRLVSSRVRAASGCVSNLIILTSTRDDPAVPVSPRTGINDALALLSSQTQTLSDKARLSDNWPVSHTDNYDQKTDPKREHLPQSIERPRRCHVQFNASQKPTLALDRQFETLEKEPRVTRSVKRGRSPEDDTQPASSDERVSIRARKYKTSRIADDDSVKLKPGSTVGSRAERQQAPNGDDLETEATPDDYIHYPENADMVLAKPPYDIRSTRSSCLSPFPMSDMSWSTPLAQEVGFNQQRALGPPGKRANQSVPAFPAAQPHLAEGPSNNLFPCVEDYEPAVFSPSSSASRRNTDEVARRESDARPTDTRSEYLISPDEFIMSYPRRRSRRPSDTYPTVDLRHGSHEANRSMEQEIIYARRESSLGLALVEDFDATLAKRNAEMSRKGLRLLSDFDIAGQHRIDEGVSDEELLRQMLVRYTGGSDVLGVSGPDE